MLQGPQPSSRSRKKPINTRTRARTDYEKPPVAHSNNMKMKMKKQAPKHAQDDLLDLFGSFAANNDKSNNVNANANANPFGDPFGDFVFGDNNKQNKNQNNNNKDMNGHNNESKMNGESIMESQAPKKQKKKKKKKILRVRAQTVANKSVPSNNNNNTNNNTNTNTNNNNKNKIKNGTATKSAVKMKKIDVLPLLHKGIRANKFKLNGNKSKVRTFYLTESNFYFCWEAVGGQSEKKSLFGGKNKGQSNRSKIDKDRSIPIRAIRSLQKNPAYMMQSYNFIPPQQKALTLSIAHSVNGQDKKLNFMSYEAFHHQLFYEGLQELIEASRDPKRNLNEVFELYVDFPKETLPKHLRPQRFKWEPLGDNDFIQQNNNDIANKNNLDKNKNNQNEANNNNDLSFGGIDVYDPTQAQYGRNRVKSF